MQIARLLDAARLPLPAMSCVRRAASTTWRPRVAHAMSSRAVCSMPPGSRARATRSRRSSPPLAVATRRRAATWSWCVAATTWSIGSTPPRAPKTPTRVPTDFASQAALSLFEDTVIDHLFALNADRAAEEAAASGRAAPTSTTGTGAAKATKLRGQRTRKTSSNQPFLLEDD